jgi:transcriptional regulator with XRE-family HTH domain
VHVDSDLYQQTLGDELRKLRKRRGWTRKQLNQHLQSDISLQTLATYELGTRQCSVVRLAEICIALGEQPHEVLARVDKTLFAGAPGEVQIDLAKVADSTLPELLPLRRWAADRLISMPASAEVSLNLAAIERMAELCGIKPAELLDRLRELSSLGTPNAYTHADD